MKKLTKKQTAQLRRTTEQLRDYVLQLGGRLEGPNELQGEICMKLPTAAGDLDVHVYDDWVACCFRDAARGDLAVLLDIQDGNGVLNTHSLKYNIQGSGEYALNNPEEYLDLCRRHLLKTQNPVRDRQIICRRGPKTVMHIENLPVVYEGSAEAWLLAHPTGPNRRWEEGSTVRNALGNQYGRSWASRVIGDNHFACQVKR